MNIEEKSYTPFFSPVVYHLVVAIGKRVPRGFVNQKRFE